MPSRVPKFDRRLLGTWKSDRQRTFRHFVPGSGATPEGIDKFKALFGKMTIRWGYRHYHTDLDGSKNSQPYEFVARDSESVVIRHFDSLSPELQLMHIHFDGAYYWVWAWGIREYFKKVKR